MIALAVANGSLRQFGYARYMSELHAHQVSTLTAIILFAIYIGLVLRRWPPVSAQQALAVGLMWLLLTIAFEFGLGLSTGASWQKLLHDYNIAAGRVWILVPAWLGIAPYLFYRWYAASP